MRKTLTIGLVSICALLLGFLLIAEWWAGAIFHSIINSNPDRAYDLSYEDLRLHTFLKGITLKSPEIHPINVNDTSTVINGKVQFMELSGISWIDFFFFRKAKVKELIFVTPVFNIALVPNPGHGENQNKSGREFQSLFGDILSRGEIRNFRLENGSVQARNKSDSLLVATISNFNLAATDIVTDSVQVKSMIPFQVGEFSSSLDSAYFYLNEYTELRSGKFTYQANNSQLELRNISLAFTKDLATVSNQVGEQVDLVEASVEMLRFNQLDAQSNLYTDLDIRARSILVDGLVFKDFRDKNKPRPPGREKPMFNGMIELIPISLKVDSILIKNSEIIYSELSEQQEQPGIIRFAEVQGNILQVTTIPGFQQAYKSLSAQLSTKLNGTANMQVSLEVPYHQATFHLHTTTDGFKGRILNKTVEPLADVAITSGYIHRFDMKMNAGKSEALNTLVFDYDSLQLVILKGEVSEQKKKGLLSAIANGAIKQNHMPDQKHYQVAEYKSFRNIYRSPFNYMWESIKEGLLFIVPTGATGFLLGDIEKKAKKSQTGEETKKKK